MIGSLRHIKLNESDVKDSMHKHFLCISNMNASFIYCQRLGELNNNYMSKQVVIEEQTSNSN